MVGHGKASGFNLTIEILFFSSHVCDLLRVVRCSIVSISQLRYFSFQEESAYVRAEQERARFNLTIEILFFSSWRC